MSAQSSTKPIKREPGLLRFSQEHHYGLLLVWKIRAGLRKQVAPERIADFCMFFFEHDLQKHFKSEEQHLFSKLSPENPMRQRALADHQRIGGLIDELRGGNLKVDLLTELADTIEQHIRYEERTLFNELQLMLSAEELTELVKIHNSKTLDVSDQWEDKFWESKK